MNEQIILDQLRRGGKLARKDLGKISGLSKPTIALALANLERDGLVRMAGKSAAGHGPAAVLYEVRPDAAFILGLDVGREYVRAAVVDLAGTTRSKGQRKVHLASSTSRLAQLISLADEVTGELGIARSDIIQTVVGSPGVYDSSRRALSMARGYPGWERPNVLDELRKAFGEQMAIENDVNLAALAEHELGQGKGVSDFAFVSLGTGLGLGLVIGGKLHRGVHGAAGEIGFMPLGEGRDVDVGDARRRGLLESTVSAAGIVRAARRSGARWAVNARGVFARAEQGDPLCQSIVAEKAVLLARAIAALASVVDPELVVLGGGIGQVSFFADAVQRELHKLVMLPIRVCVSALGDDAVIKGCLVAGSDLAWQQVMQR